MYYEDVYHIGSIHESFKDCGQIVDTSSPMELEVSASQADSVPKWPTEQLPQQRHRDWLHASPPQILNSHTVQYRQPPAQSGPKSQGLFFTDRKYGASTETTDFGATGIPVTWVEVSGFPRQATAEILKSFHAVGRIRRMRETPDGIYLRYSDRMGLYHAMQLDGKRIYRFHVVVKPLLGDPQGWDPLVYPTKPQFPYMHESKVQGIVGSGGWKEKVQQKIGFGFFLWFTFFMWVVKSIGKVQKWGHKQFHMTR